MRMSDDVEARFAAVRVSYQQGHIPCRSARFTSSCARETNQSAVRMSLKSVRWKESLTSSSSKMDTTENCFSSQSSKNPPCQTAPQTGAGLQRKPPQMGSLLVMKKTSAVNVCASPGCCHQIAAIVCKCARWCSVIACHN